MHLWVAYMLSLNLYHPLWFSFDETNPNGLCCAALSHHHRSSRELYRLMESVLLRNTLCRQTTVLLFSKPFMNDRIMARTAAC